MTKDQEPTKAPWTIKMRLLVICLPIVVVALALGLGVGLGVGLRDKRKGIQQNEKYWEPEVSASWQIELLYPINDTSIDVDVYDIDLFDTSKSTIDALRADGRRVVCYFSAGSYENWRPDAHKFNNSDLGNPLDGWPGERWVNTSSEGVRDIMKTRLDLAASKNCDGVDPDNVDAYGNDNGLNLTSEDAAGYVNWLADEAHSRSLAIGLKNGGDIIERVIDKMQWSVNEQCAQYNECDKFVPFIDTGKPVFHIEYPKGDDVNNDDPVSDEQKRASCDFDQSAHFSTLMKNMDLDNWYQNC